MILRISEKAKCNAQLLLVHMMAISRFRRCGFPWLAALVFVGNLSLSHPGHCVAPAKKWITYSAEGYAASRQGKFEESNRKYSLAILSARNEGASPTVIADLILCRADLFITLNRIETARLGLFEAGKVIREEELTGTLLEMRWLRRNLRLSKMQGNFSNAIAEQTRIIKIIGQHFAIDSGCYLDEIFILLDLKLNSKDFIGSSKTLRVFTEAIKSEQANMALRRCHSAIDLYLEKVVGNILQNASQQPQLALSELKLIEASDIPSSRKILAYKKIRDSNSEILKTECNLYLTKHAFKAD